MIKEEKQLGCMKIFVVLRIKIFLKTRRYHFLILSSLHTEEDRREKDSIVNLAH